MENAIGRRADGAPAGGRYDSGSSFLASRGGVSATVFPEALRRPAPVTAAPAPRLPLCSAARERPRIRSCRRPSGRHAAGASARRDDTGRARRPAMKRMSRVWSRLMPRRCSIFCAATDSASRAGACAGDAQGGNGKATTSPAASMTLASISVGHRRPSGSPAMITVGGRIVASRRDTTGTPIAALSRSL